MHVVIFEGNLWHSFIPVALGRPVFMLATGMSTLLEKQIRHTNPSRLTLWVRPELEELVKQRIVPKLHIPADVNVPLDDEPALLVSGRSLFFRKFDAPQDPSVILDEDAVVRIAYVKNMAGLSPSDVLSRSDKWLSITQLPPMPPQTRLVEHLWDLIKWNEESLIEDYANRGLEFTKPSDPRFHCVEPDQISLHPEAHVGPNCVLDATRGPIVIEEHANIGANSVIEGPCYIGPYVSITPLTLVRPGTSLGMMCKVGGEISNTIMFGYSNKVHDGFMGDCYIGKWVNFGAGTITSNLKNTYGEIDVHTQSGPLKTGRRFLGALVGDHTKTAIGTRLMAGTYVGFNAMIATSGIPPRVIPSFTFLSDKGKRAYEIQKAMEVQKIAFSRRNRGWSEMDAYISTYVSQIAPTVEPPFNN